VHLFEFSLFRQKGWLTSVFFIFLKSTQRIKAFWKRIFDDILDSQAIQEDYRGLQREEAITIYVSSMDEAKSQELFSIIKKLHSTAAMNCEALRKLVKKFDKGALARGDEQLTSTLLYELYSASFSSYVSLEGHIETLRDLLVVSEEEEDDEVESDDEIYSYQEKSSLSSHHDGAVVKRRAEEQNWLTSMLASIPPNEISYLVAHRGFHCPRDASSKRPQENSLSAFEMAWAAGIHLCECDVALTKDEKLVLAHDEDFSRLALNPESDYSKMKVGDLTMKEIISLTFKSGSRPPLLLDVLRSAQALGSNCKLVIEIKPGNIEASSALVRLFRHHPDLIESCAVIMSFDAFIMHRLKSELEEMKYLLMGGGGSLSVSPSTRHTLKNRAHVPITLPKVLLLTVAKAPKQHYQLWLDILNWSPVHSWLKHANRSSLDGGELLEHN
jgi:glycerophosphoryl diester phosphodiesterase